MKNSNTFDCDCWFVCVSCVFVCFNTKLHVYSKYANIDSQILITYSRIQFFVLFLLMFTFNYINNIMCRLILFVIFLLINIIYMNFAIHLLIMNRYLIQYYHSYDFVFYFQSFQIHLYRLNFLLSLLRLHKYYFL